MSKLQKWFEQHTGKERVALAKRAGISLTYLWQCSTGRRNVSAAKAAAIETAAAQLNIPLPRGDLCEVCHDCPYYKRSK